MEKGETSLLNEPKLFFYAMELSMGGIEFTPNSISNPTYLVGKKKRKRRENRKGEKRKEMKAFTLGWI